MLLNIEANPKVSNSLTGELGKGKAVYIGRSWSDDVANSSCRVGGVITVS